ncbi:hypothetical protein B0H11DRAFT_2229823 [Mycena galericulata]|nr:hypothetical protein B0H11DRAFT_2229823 [Mycena galericulata]
MSDDQIRQLADSYVQWQVDGRPADQTHILDAWRQVRLVSRSQALRALQSADLALGAAARIRRRRNNTSSCPHCHASQTKS